MNFKKRNSKRATENTDSQVAKRQRQRILKASRENDLLYTKLSPIRLTEFSRRGQMGCDIWDTERKKLVNQEFYIQHNYLS